MEEDDTPPTDTTADITMSKRDDEIPEDKVSVRLESDDTETEETDGAVPEVTDNVTVGVPLTWNPDPAISMVVAPIARPEVEAVIAGC